MRIGVVQNAPPGGARRADGELIRRLGARHRLEVFPFGHHLEPLAATPAGAALVEPVPIQRRRRLRLAFPINDLVAWQELRTLERVGRALARRLDERRYDCVLVTTCQDMYVPPILAYLRSPSLYYCHDKPLNRFYGPMHRPEAGPMTRYERARQRWQRPTQALVDVAIRRGAVRHARAATMLVANSRFTARWIRAVYGREAEVCYLGVDADKFAPAQRSRCGVISVGALEAHKGFDFVIRALGRIEKGRRPPLTIVGSPGNRHMPDYLARLARQEDVSLQLLTTFGAQGGGADIDLVAQYQTSSLFVFASHGEPWGLVLLEAMACGLPVVAVHDGAVPEAVAPGVSGLLAPRDEAAFANAVDRLLVDGATRAAMSHAARQRAVTFTWEAASDRLEQLLGRVANGHPALLNASRP